MPVVVVIALISAAIWAFFGPAPQFVYTLVIATTVLISACPCALGLAPPMSIISGVGRAAEFGVLVRDADALQRASTLDRVVFYKSGPLPEVKGQVVAVKTFADVDEAQALRLAAALEQGSSHPLARAILDKAGDMQLPRASTLDTVVFDKTGTLTEGKPQVVAVKTFADVDEAQALRMAAALEQGSSHPLARAILDKAGEMQLPQVNGFRTLRGLGVSGEAEGHALLLGNQALLNEQQVAVSAHCAGWA